MKAYSPRGAEDGASKMLVFVLSPPTGSGVVLAALTPAMQGLYGRLMGYFLNICA